MKTILKLSVLVLLFASCDKNECGCRNISSLPDKEIMYFACDDDDFNSEFTLSPTFENDEEYKRCN